MDFVSATVWKARRRKVRVLPSAAEVFRKITCFTIGADLAEVLQCVKIYVFNKSFTPIYEYSTLIQKRRMILLQN